MALKLISQKPKTNDEVLLRFETKDSYDCSDIDPYKIDKLVIYFIERDFSRSNLREMSDIVEDNPLYQAYLSSKNSACINPTDENFQKLSVLAEQLRVEQEKNKTYYDNAKPVLILGSVSEPAWLITDQENSQIQYQTDDDGANIEGNFEYVWRPQGQREGDYVLTWVWTPIAGGDSYCKTKLFRLYSATEDHTLLPNRRTREHKYNILFERYTPEAFKSFQLSNDDLTPFVLKGMHDSFADAFEMLENLSNQMGDMLDANVTQEAFLPVLGEMYGVDLKSNDPTLWRRQIKQSIGLRKKKGTLAAFRDALSQAGMRLVTYNPLWKTRSKYTKQDFFIAANPVSTFTLSNKPIVPVDPNHVEVYYRSKAANSSWEKLTSDHVQITVDGDDYYATWSGNNLSTNPVDLVPGDSIRIIYQYEEFPSSAEETLELFIRTLPIADQRDERLFELPPKDWDSRVIEETDTMFSVIVANRHPFADPIIFGKVRTEFPFSENIYNAEEYNGSLRSSENPCHIDPEFIEDCTSCRSGLFNIDVEIEDLSDDRIQELLSIVDEWTPANAILHSVGISGKNVDFMPPPEENISVYGKVNLVDNVLLGQFTFNRSMTESERLLRDELNQLELVVDAESGTLRNNSIAFYCPTVNFGSLPKDIDTTSVAKLLIESGVDAGTYSVDYPWKNYLYMNGGDITEPISQSSLPFKYYLEYVQKASTSITKKDLVLFSDASGSILEENVVTEKEGDAWVLTVGGNDYPIRNFVANGVIIEDNSGNISSTSSITYTLRDSAGNIILTGNDGTAKRKKVAEVDFSTPGSILIDGSSANLGDFANILRKKSYVKYDGSFYRVISTHETEALTLVIEGYSGSDVAGVSVSVIQLLAEGVGSFHYSGMMLDAGQDLETNLEIVNGENAVVGDFLDDDSFMEDFLIEIDSNMYRIAHISGSTVKLDGLLSDETLTGSSCTYDVYKVKRNPISIPDRTPIITPGGDFTNLDRTTPEVITVLDTSNEDVGSLSLPGNTESLRFGQKIQVKVEYMD